MMNLKGTNVNGCEVFEKILEENKEHINFAFGDYYSVEPPRPNKYGELHNKYFDEVTFAMFNVCMWHVVTNYNETPIGDVIMCYN
jgi:hypothetical protein